MDVVTLGSIGTSAYGLRYGILHIVSAQKGNTAVANISEIISIIGTYRDVSNISQSIAQTVEIGCVDPGYIDVAVPAPGRYTVSFGMYTNLSDPTQVVTLSAGECKIVNQLTTRCWNGIKNILNAHKEKEYFKACDILHQDCDLTLDVEENESSIRYAIEVASVDNIPNHPHAVVFNTVQVLPKKMSMYVATGNKANNKVGYNFTNVAAYLDNTFYEGLPIDLRNAITPREFIGASGAANKKYPSTERHKVWAPTFTDLSPAYSNTEMYNWRTTYPLNDEYYAGPGFQSSAIDIAVQNVAQITFDSDKSIYRPQAWGRVIRYPHYAKPIAGSATLTTYASSKGYSLPSEIELCRIKTVGQQWVVPQDGVTAAVSDANQVPMLFTMQGCRYWTSTPDRKTATNYWICNSVYSTASLASTAASAISVASTYAKSSWGMKAVGSNYTYNILPCFMIAADDEFIDG